MDVTDRVYTVGMTDEEVADRLAETGTGVLALARDGEAYAVPVSFAHDGDVVRFRLADDGDSRKLAFAETTEEGCLVVHGVDGDRDSWSVVVSGPLRRLSPEDWEATDPARIDEAYVPLRVFDEAIEETQLVGYELQVASVTGRRTAE